MPTLIVLREILVHDDAAPVHGGCRIPTEGVQGEVERLTDGCPFIEEHVLTGKDGLGGHVVGVHALPSARDGTAMEDDLQTVSVGITEDILIETHGLLLVATEEVDLDALDADALHPCHLPFTGDAGIHAVAWSLGCVVPETVGVVPQHQMNTFRLGILGELGDALATDLCVPPVVDKAVLEAHGRSQVDELHLVVVVDGVVLPDEPAPGVATRLVVGGGFVERSHQVVRDGGLNDRLQTGAHGDRAPWGLTGKGDAGILRAEPVVLAFVGVGDGIAGARLVVGEVRAAIATAHTCLGDQGPALLLTLSALNMKQCREDIAMTVLGSDIHGGVGRVALLIAGLRLFPTSLWSDLRRDEGGGPVGEQETAFLLIDDRAFVFLAIELLTRDTVAESDVVVADLEDDAERPSFLILEVECQLVGMVFGRGSLGAAHGIAVEHFFFVTIFHGQSMREVANACLQSQGRFLKHL